jgi:hypothetical protein
MAESVPQGNYVTGPKKKKRKQVNALSGKDKYRKATTGGTKHAIASKGGSL